MDAQPNRSNRRRRRRKKKPEAKASPAEPVFIAARRPDSPRLEKPTRRMKAASAKPKTERQDGASSEPRLERKEEPKRRRAARIIQLKEDEIDETERIRRRLLARFMASEGRAEITRTADAYFAEGFDIPVEQDAQLKLLEHFDETRACEAMARLAELIENEEPQQLPIFRQRLRRLEDYADEAPTRDAAASLRRVLPA